MKDMPTSGRPRITTDIVESGSFNSPGEFEESSHHCTQPTDALFRTSWQAGVSVQTIRNRLYASQLKCRKAAQKPLLTAGVTIGFIDDQSCMWLTNGTERFWQISVGPHLSSLGRIFRCDHDIGTQYVTYERELIHL